MVFEKKYLLNAIQSEIEIVAIWGAYQIMQLEEDQLKPYLPHFLQSSLIDIQEAGIAKIAECGWDDFAADILGIFREAEGQLKYTAAFALSNSPNDISTSMIQKWFYNLAANDQSTRIEFEAAVYSFLNLKSSESFKKVIKTLTGTQHDIIKSSVLFKNALLFSKTETDFNSIIDQYFILRDLFSDAELTFYLVEQLVRQELKEWWTNSLSKGYSISSIYEQCYILLGFQNNLADRQFWHDIEKSFYSSGQVFRNAPNDHVTFIKTIRSWVEQLLVDREDDCADHQELLWIIKGFERNQKLFPKTIPKIMELESHALMTIPLNIILDKSVRQWLANPSQYVEEIANYYHSTLLLSDYREKILALFFPDFPEWDEKQVQIKSSDSHISEDDNKNDILWAFYRGELLGYNVSWPSIFPNPDYSRHLATGLVKIYQHNFDYFIKKQDRVSVDYALQLFQMQPCNQAIQIIIHHFKYLIQFHAETLYHTIEYLPDPAFIDLLLDQYESGEYEIARLIFLICKIFQLKIPSEINNDINDQGIAKYRSSGMKKPVRLHCPGCNNTFLYHTDNIYIDEGAIFRLNRLSLESVWVPQKFHCKKCQSNVPFQPDEMQLDELSLQSRVDRILRITPQTHTYRFGYRINLIDFPRYDGKTYSPGEFFKFTEAFEKSISPNKDELKTLWMIKARLYKALSNWVDCKKILEKVKELEKIDEEWMFIMGFVSYKLALFADARKYFKWIINKYPVGSNIAAFTPFVEKSKHYLKLMDSETSKRARFKVIKKET